MTSFIRWTDTWDKCVWIRVRLNKLPQQELLLLAQIAQVPRWAVSTRWEQIKVLPVVTRRSHLQLWPSKKRLSRYIMAKECLWKNRTWDIIYDFSEKPKFKGRCSNSAQIRLATAVTEDEERVFRRPRWRRTGPSAIKKNDLANVSRGVELDPAITLGEPC